MEETKTSREMRNDFERLMLDLQMEISKEINFLMFKKGKHPTYIVVSLETFELLKISSSQIVDPRGLTPRLMGLKLIIDAEFTLYDFKIM
jgi:hypothetical protein